MSTCPVLAAEFVQAVVEHMNSDHAESVLCIARHHSGGTTIDKAVMSGLDSNTLFLSVDSAGNTSELAIPLPKAIRDPADVRGILIRMSRTARGA